ncbi:SSU ribosomal protein S26E [Giardia duodenalis]|nr:SSU ribosomal protein S26E [Giardia intestinalis]
MHFLFWTRDMPVKRRNNGRSKYNCGHTNIVRCQNCHRCVPKDKVIKRFTIRNIVDNTIADDVLNACVIQGFAIPKLYNKVQYCVSCSIHNHIVRVRSREDRKIRTPPKRFPRNSSQKK